MKRVLLIIIIVVVVIITAGTIYLILNTSTSSKNNAGEIPKSTQRENKDVYTYSPGSSFVTNLKGNKRFLKVSLMIETDNKDYIDVLSKNNHKIRDVIIWVLRGKSEDEAAVQDFQDVLKSDIKKAIETEINKDGITGISFSELVIQ